MCPTEANAERVWAGLASFGAPLTDLTLADLSTPGTVFQIGVPPCRIDIMTAIDGVTFEDAWAGRQAVRLGDVEVAVIGRAELLANKRASGRPKDLADIAILESEPE